MVTSASSAFLYAIVVARYRKQAKIKSRKIFVLKDFMKTSSEKTILIGKQQY